MPRLDAAQAEQKVDVASLPRETLAVYEAKGRLLTQIEKMNKVAGIVFWDRSDISGQLNKDVLKRARKSRGDKGSSGTTGTSS